MTTYDEYLNQLKEQHNLTAKTALRRLYELLKLEDPLLSNDDIYDRMMKDCIQMWQKETIQKSMPDELKDKERQASGRKGREKLKVIVTSNGSVASANPATLPEPEHKTQYPGYPSPYHQDPPVGMNGARLEELELENGRLKEQLKEQRDQIGELIKSINAAAALKKQDKTTSKVEDSLEYKTMLSQLTSAETRIFELEQVISKQMKENPSQTFQSAADIPGITTITTTISDGEVIFDLDSLKKFWPVQRYSQKLIYCKLEGNKIVEFESDTERNSKK